MTIQGTQNSLEMDILRERSANIVGFFLDAEDTHNIGYDLRKTAMTAAGKIICEPERNSDHTSYLKGLLEKIAENNDDKLQNEVKELLISLVNDIKLSEIALDKTEDEKLRIKAVERMTDIDLLLDIASDADSCEVRQAAKAQVKGLR